MSISRLLKWLFWVLLSSLSLLSWKKICYAPHCHSNLSLFSLQSLAINYQKKNHCHIATVSSGVKGEKQRSLQKYTFCMVGMGLDGVETDNNLVSFFPQAYLLFTFLNISIVKERVLSPKLTFYRIKGRVQDLNKIIHPSRCKLLKQLQITLYTHSKYSHLLSLSRERIKSF